MILLIKQVRLTVSKEISNYMYLPTDEQIKTTVQLTVQYNY